jgi:hypothetical protein
MNPSISPGKKQSETFSACGVPISPAFLLAYFALSVLSMSCGKSGGERTPPAGFAAKRASENAEYDWPCWRRPDGNGESRETGWEPKALAKGPKILWRTNVGFGYSSVTVEDGRLYTMGRRREKNDINNVVYSLNA